MQGINKQTMLDLIIDAKRNEPEDVRFSDWLAEYLAEHLSTLTPPNEPLTIEQLREMDGEPVYIYCVIFPEDCGWRVIAGADVLRVYFTDCTSLSLTDYDKSWLAYRRPPEGEGDI